MTVYLRDGGLMGGVETDLFLAFELFGNEDDLPSIVIDTDEISV